MRRRDFVGLAAAALPLRAARIDIGAIKSRGNRKPEIVYKSPYSKPNALQATPEGLWVQDQGASPEHVTLVNYADGKIIRDFTADIVGASGVTVDDDGVMWLTSTHNSLIVSCSPQDGKTIAKYWTPGAGRIYAMKGDPPAARSPLTSPFPAPEGRGGGQGRGQGGGQGAAGAAAGAGQAAGGGAPGAGRAGGRGGRGGPPGQLPLDATTGLSGTGAHGIEHRDGLLYFANPPARHIYVMEPKTWTVQDWWPVPGNRPHGVGWEGDTLWNADSNMRAFFRFDYKTGKIVEKIQLTEKDPLIHGVTIHDGYMWYCDDVGYICNFKL